MNESQAPGSNAYTRTFQRAAQSLGGVDALAARLDVPLEALKRWMGGSEFPPHEAFIEALEIVARGPMLDHPQQRARNAQAHADRLQAAADRVRESAACMQATAELAQAQANLLRQADRNVEFQQEE